jgi:2-polyprenyl-3-methyl-5-hydroxy-6-metoxy-1,4-benzoquinol methylase
MPVSPDRQAWIEQLAASDWKLQPHLLSELDDNTLHFMALELTGAGRAKRAYLDRVDYHGLTGAHRVLDFGCGVGQWCIALAERNDCVIGIDKTLPRLHAAQQLVASQNATNIVFGANIEDFPDLVPSSVDLIICYSVFMFLDGKAVAEQFHQLLRPGGRLYMMVDLPTWHLRTLAKRPMAIPILSYMALRTLFGQQRNIVYTRTSLNRLLKKAGFEIVSSGADGCASFLAPGARPAKSVDEFLPNHFLGLQTLYEICAIKI